MSEEPQQVSRRESWTRWSLWLRRTLLWLALGLAATAVLDPRHLRLLAVSGLLSGLLWTVSTWRKDRRRAVLGLSMVASLAISAACVGPFFRGDSVRYFEHLRSWAFDRDLDYANDATLLGVDPRPNVFAVGPALAWSPAYAAAHVYAVFSDYEANGYSMPYRRSAALATSVWVVLAMALLLGALSQRLGRGVAVTACLGGLLISPIPYYVWVLPSMAHGVAFAAAALLLWAVIRADENPSARSWVLVGVALGLVTLMRWQAIVSVALVSLVALKGLIEGRDRARWLAAGAATSALAVLPQLIIWRLQFGSYLTIPQGQRFMDWSSPRLLDVLLSANHGLFVWHPWLLLGLAGLVVGLFLRGWRIVAAGSLLTFAACAWVNGSVRTWHGDDAFGARRFDAVMPMLVLGMGLLVFVAVPLLRRFPLALPCVVLGAGFSGMSASSTSRKGGASWEPRRSKSWRASKPRMWKTRERGS